MEGFRGPQACDAIMRRFAAIPMIVPDHVAADLRNRCRRRGAQLETIEALLVRLCLRHDLLMLTTDRNFHRAARHVPLRVWSRHWSEPSSQP